jgi:hypothetical protein
MLFVQYLQQDNSSKGYNNLSVIACFFCNMRVRFVMSEKFNLRKVRLRQRWQKDASGLVLVSVATASSNLWMTRRNARDVSLVILQW